MVVGAAEMDKEEREEVRQLAAQVDREEGQGKVK